MKFVKPAVFLMLLISFAGSLTAGETKLSMEIWNRYSANLDGTTLTSGLFSVERGYFSLEPVISDNLKGRFTLDFFSSDKFADGVGIKMKYAYVDFKTPVPDMSLQAGMIKTYFGTIYDWTYATIDKSFDDKNKIVSSADYGIAASGLIPAGFGEYAVSIYNGEGYSKTGSLADANPAFAFNLRLIPLTGITLGGSVLYEDHSLLTTPDSLTVSDTVRICGIRNGTNCFWSN